MLQMHLLSPDRLVERSQHLLHGTRDHPVHLQTVPSGWSKEQHRIQSMQYLFIHYKPIRIQMISIQWHSFNITAICSYFGNTKWPKDDYFGQKM